ncbi:hypothetical protein, partial [Klebsiella pneumoniae]|uniref:hypothetical protein n=1 Tax=Klebsiella pneumoniae TaxID=573 RepID=UPI001F07C895
NPASYRVVRTKSYLFNKAGGDQHPHRSSRKDVMKRLALALLLFIFKELVVASVLTPEADHYDSYLLVGT